MSLDAQETCIKDYKSKVTNGELEINGDERLTDLVGFSVIQDVTPIRRLVIRNCKNFENLSGIGDLQDTLEELIIDGTRISDTRQFSRLDYRDRCYDTGVLTHLELTNNKYLEVIDGIKDDKKNIQSIKTLILRGNGLKSIEGIRPLRFVEHLDLSDNPWAQFDEIRFLQCFPFAKYINISKTGVAKMLIVNKPVENAGGASHFDVLYFCLPRQHIETLIYDENNQNLITDEVKNRIFEIQEKPLTEIKQNVYSVFDFHRILLTQWDYMDINEHYDPFTETLDSQEAAQRELIAQISSVYEFQRELTQKIQHQKERYNRLKDLIAQLAEERELFVQREQERIRGGFAPVRSK